MSKDGKTSDGHGGLRQKFCCPLRSLRFFSTVLTLTAARKFCAGRFNFTIPANPGAAARQRLFVLPALPLDLLRFSRAASSLFFTACFAHP